MNKDIIIILPSVSAVDRNVSLAFLPAISACF